MSDSPGAIYTRTIRCEARLAGEGEIEVTGRLLDERPDASWWGEKTGSTVHDMSLSVRVRLADLVVTAVGGSMATHPYTLCPEALPPLSELVGLSVARGFTRAVNERLGRQHGCAHLTALVHAMAPVIKQGAGTQREAEPTAGDDLWFVNTCHAWREGGPLHARLRAGDLAGLRALSAYPRAAEATDPTEDRRPGPA